MLPQTLQRFVAEEVGEGRKPGLRPCTSRTARRARSCWSTSRPGRVENAEPRKRNRSHAIVCVAAYSRHMFLHPSCNEIQATVIEALEAAWQFFGGVFAAAVFPDELRAVMANPDGVTPLIAQGFLFDSPPVAPLSARRGCASRRTRASGKRRDIRARGLLLQRAHARLAA